MTKNGKKEEEEEEKEKKIQEPHFTTIIPHSLGMDQSRWGSCL